MFLSRSRAALLAIALFFAGCSSPTVDIASEDASEADADSATTEAPPETAPSTVPSTTAAPATTVTPIETTVPAEEAVGEVFEIKAEHAEYCAVAAEARVADETMGEDGFLDPAKLEPFLANNLVLLEKARNKVPAEIADDFAIFIAGNYAIDRVLAENGYEFIAILDDPVFNDPEFEAASEAVDEFGTSACGFADEPEIEVDNGEESSAVTAEDIAQMEQLLATEVGRQAFVEGLAESMGITEEQGNCFIDEIGAEGLAGMVLMNETGATDNQVVADTLAAARACDIDL